MPASYSVALVAIIIADVRPLRAIRGPYLAPAPIPVRRIAGDKRSTKERKVAEMVMPEREGVRSVDLAGEGCASKAVSARDEYAPAGDHAPPETATTEPTATEMHATADPTMHATESTTAALCHGRRCESNCRSKHGR
jgi:hypothetical protein